MRASDNTTNISFCIDAVGNVGINSEFPSSKLEIFDLTYSEAITQSTPNYNSAIKVKYIKHQILLLEILVV